MPAFSLLAPIIGSAVTASSNNTNRRNQFELGNLQNAFSVFTGQGRQDLSGLLKNDSAGTVLKGVTAGLQAKKAEENAKAQDDKVIAETEFKQQNAQQNRNLLQSLFGGGGQNAAQGGVAANLRDPQSSFQTLQNFQQAQRFLS